MKLIFLLIFTCALLLHQTQSKEKCLDKHEECYSTNYQSYVDCVRKRSKRSVDCEDCEGENCLNANTCNECDCTSCSYSSCSGNNCNNCCNSCCNNHITCRTNHCCHKTCHTQCNTSTCRSSCRKNCFESVRNIKETKVIIKENQQSTSSNLQGGSSSTSSKTDLKHNVTTIIHLNNIINNTNVIDIPISLNNTNQQNVTLQEDSSFGYQSGGTSSPSGEKCCVVISPRKCVPQKEPPYAKCFHYRSQQCGAFCTTSIVHKEEQQICQSDYPGSAPSCQKRIMYIPQPQPRCTYQSAWPYVSCGIQKPQYCDGCYGHYSDPSSKAHLNCPGQCYDDGFSVGPHYRQGPFYRPGYSHVPCYNCFGYGGMDPYGGFGGFGHQGLPYGGYPPVMPYFRASVPMEQESLGSWTPNVEGIDGNKQLLDPTIEVLNQAGFANPSDSNWRIAREVEIEVAFEPDRESSVQAEVKINNDKIEKRVYSNTDKNSNVTETGEAFKKS